MKAKILQTIMVLLLGLSIVNADDPSKWDGYQSRTIQEIIQDNMGEKRELDVLPRSPTDNKNDSIFIYDKYKIQVIFIGSSRQILASRKKHIVEWAKAIRLESSVPGMFTSELLFSDGQINYWLPVQKGLASSFNEELHSGDKVTLYVGYTGAMKIQNKWDDIFIVNEFQKNE